MPVAPPAHPTLELPRADASPPPPSQPPVMSGSGRGRELTWVLATALAVALVAAVWQGVAAADARSQLAALEDRTATLEADLETLRADNAQLRTENSELRASAEADGGSVSGLLAPLLRGETPSEEEILEFLWPYIGDRIGDGLGELGDQLGRGLEDLFGNG